MKMKEWHQGTPAKGGERGGAGKSIGRRMLRTREESEKVKDKVEIKEVSRNCCLRK